MMQTWASLLLSEVRYLISRPHAAIFAGLWLFCFGLWTFFGCQLLDHDEASLRGPFAILPWMLALVSPWIGLELWHPRHRPGHEEWLHSLGLNGVFRISAQTAAGCLLSFVLILSSLPVVGTVMLLGRIDYGILRASLLGLCLLSVWQLCLCGWLLRYFTRSWTAGLSCSLLLVLLEALGHAPCLAGVNQLIPGLKATLLMAMSPGHHLETFLRGIVDSRDFVYFVGGASWFLAAHILLQRLQRSLNLRRRSQLPAVFWLLLSSWLFYGVALIIFGQRSLWRADWTDEKLYTLAEGSQALLSRMTEPLNISLYFSKSQPHIDSQLLLHGQRIEELLGAYASFSPRNIRISSIDPIPDSPAEAAARLAGLRSFKTASSDTYLGAVLSSGDKSIKIPFFDPRNEKQLEYQLSEAIVKVAQTSKLSLGLLTSLPLASDRGEAGARLRPDWAIIAALRSFYQITRLPDHSIEIPSSISTLLIVHPKNVSELTEFAIDQFLLRGGHLVIAVDPFCETELAYSSSNSSGNSDPMSSNLPTLFAAWGIKFDSHRMLGDLDRGTAKTTLQQNFTDPFQMNLIAEDINRDHQITRNLQQLQFSEPGWFEIKADAQKKWEVLVQSSAKSSSISTDRSSYMSTQQLAQQLRPDGQIRSLAGIMTATWPTAFPQKPSGSPIEQPLQKSLSASSIVLIADVDFLADPNAVEKLQVMNQMLIRPRNDNVNLVTHAIEFLVGNHDLMSIRSSGPMQRSLTRLQAIDLESKQPWIVEEAKLNGKIEEVERQISDLIMQEEGSSSLLSQDQELELHKLRTIETGYLTDRRLLREKKRSTPDIIRRAIIMLHLLALPAGLFAFNVWWQTRDRRRQRLVDGTDFYRVH